MRAGNQKEEVPLAKAKEAKYSAHQIRHGVVGPTVGIPPAGVVNPKIPSGMQALVGGPLGGAMAG